MHTLPALMNLTIGRKSEKVSISCGRVVSQSGAALTGRRLSEIQSQHSTLDNAQRSFIVSLAARVLFLSVRRHLDVFLPKLVNLRKTLQAAKCTMKFGLTRQLANRRRNLQAARMRIQRHDLTGTIDKHKPTLCKTLGSSAMLSASFAAGT